MYSRFNTKRWNLGIKYSRILGNLEYLEYIVNADFNIKFNADLNIGLNDVLNIKLNADLNIV